LKILATGNAGKIGRMQVKMLREAGHEVRTFDTRPPCTEQRGDIGEHHFGDLRDLLAVRRAVYGVDAIVHLGAIPSDRPGRGEDVLSVNVQGTWNVLFAAVEADIRRVVVYSSVNALGCVGGHRPVERLPVRDDYPRHPMTPYQLSKHLAEETCRSFTERHGIVTACLRPVYVVNPDEYERFRERAEQVADWPGAIRELWAYVDVRDVCQAALLALEAENLTHDGFLLTADDTTSTVPTAELVERHYRDTPWPDTDPGAYLASCEHRSLIDCAHAKEVLGWQPRHSWRSETERTGDR
jgi:UDP-glucose 4-epimerase